MFMVIEHLNNPDEIIKGIYNILNPEGIFICETPNADDALISKEKLMENTGNIWSSHWISIKN
ncbi:MAG: class I SAM-dependent methyltransferase [Lachnospiraceae bacterium]|nr:class I SAM-dependent methyltransferase [Lachnospiraceae bacterium]